MGRGTESVARLSRRFLTGQTISEPSRPCSLWMFEYPNHIAVTLVNRCTIEIAKNHFSAESRLTHRVGQLLTRGPGSAERQVHGGQHIVILIDFLEAVLFVQLLQSGIAMDSM